MDSLTAVHVSPRCTFCSNVYTLPACGCGLPDGGTMLPCLTSPTCDVLKYLTGMLDRLLAVHAYDRLDSDHPTMLDRK